MTAISRTVRIGSSHGLHARPAKLFAQAAKESGISVIIAKVSGKPVNAASILGVIALAVEHGDYVTLSADGDGADGVLDRLTELPENTPSTGGTDAERTRAREAVAAVAAELQQRADAAGGAAQEVLEAQAMIAEDPTLQDDVDARIDDGGTAEWAVHDAFAGFRATLEAVGGYLGERAADLDDIAQRVLAHLRGLDAPGVPDPGHPFVLVARDLAPADTALLNLEQVLALITTDGGPTSHTAILAREKGIVAIVGATAATALENGTTVIVDAAAGTVTTDPTRTRRHSAAGRTPAAAQAVTPRAFLGPAAQAAAHELPTSALLEAVAATLAFDDPADEQSVELQRMLRTEDADVLTATVTGLEPEHPLFAEVHEVFAARQQELRAR